MKTGKRGIVIDLGAVSLCQRDLLTPVTVGRFPEKGGIIDRIGCQRLQLGPRYRTIYIGPVATEARNSFSEILESSRLIFKLLSCINFLPAVSGLKNIEMQH